MMNYFEKHNKIRIIIAVLTGIAYGISLAFREIGTCCWVLPGLIGVAGSITWLGMIIYAYKRSKIG